LEVAPQELIWTSGGTEANNLAIKGIQPAWCTYGSTDHPAVMEAALSLPRAWPIPVDAEGHWQTQALADFLAQQRGRGVVSTMIANNETGVLQRLDQIVAVIQQARRDGLEVWWHVDAVQGFGKTAFTVPELGCDLLTVSSHKIYGPKGAGALWCRPDVPLQPIQHGGAQERGLRGGTENLSALVGFGAAAARIPLWQDQQHAHTQALQQQLESGLIALGATIFAQHSPRLSNTTQFALPGWDGEALLMQLDRAGFAVSSGSACASGLGEPSHVLLAMGIEAGLAKGAVRVSTGLANTAEQVDGFLAALKNMTAGFKP
jgi:cysteine desulfurase